MRRQRHRRDATAHVAATAFIAQDRKDVVVIGVRRRNGLVRAPGFDADQDTERYECQCDRRVCRATDHLNSPNAVSASATAALNAAYTASICARLPTSPAASRSHAVGTTRARAGSPASRLSAER